MMKLFNYSSQVIVFIATTKRKRNHFLSLLFPQKYGICNKYYAMLCHRHKTNETAVPIRYTLSLDNIITIIHRNYQ